MAVSRTSADHAAHDELILAVLASGDDLPAGDLARAQAQLRDCAECALVVADLRAIQAATADLPAPPRRRDFRLTEEDAARLRARGWRRLLAAFGSPRDRITGPAAAGLATIGVAGLLFLGVTNGPSQALSTLGAPLQAPAAADMSTVTGGAAAPEMAGAPSPAADQMATRSATAFPSDAKLVPEVPLASGEPVPGATAPDGAGNAGTVPAESAGPMILAVPASAEPAGGAEPGAAAIGPADAQVAEQPPVAGEATAPSESGGTSTTLAVALLSVAALAAGIALVVLRLVGRRMAEKD